MTMPLLNVVCFGGGRYKKRYKDRQVLHSWVRSELPDEGGSGRIDDDTGRFRLEEWHPTPWPGMLAYESLVTYVPAHASHPSNGSWLGATTEDDDTWVPLDMFGDIGGSAVVLDACNTASDDWLYDHGRLRAECKSLAGKPLLGGSGEKGPLPHYNILGPLIDELIHVQDTAMSDGELLSLLKEVLTRAVMKSPRSNLTEAYAVRMVTPTPSEVWTAR